MHIVFLTWDGSSIQKSATSSHDDDWRFRRWWRGKCRLCISLSKKGGMHGSVVYRTRLRRIWCGAGWFVVESCFRGGVLYCEVLLWCGRCLVCRGVGGLVCCEVLLWGGRYVIEWLRCGISGSLVSRGTAHDPMFVWIYFQIMRYACCCSKRVFKVWFRTRYW